MSISRSRTIAGWILAVVLALLFLAAAAGKLSGAATGMFEAWGYPGWFALVIGICELLGAIGLLVPKATRCAILGLGVIMLGAIYTHFANGEAGQVIRPLLFLGGLGSLWLVRYRAGN